MLAIKQEIQSPFVQLPIWIIDNLSCQLQKAYTRIARYDWGNGCWASIERLRQNFCSDRQMRHYISQLKRLGLIEVQQRQGQTLLIRLLDPTPVIERTEPRQSTADPNPGKNRHKPRQKPAPTPAIERIEPRQLSVPNPGSGLPTKKNKYKQIKKQQQSVLEVIVNPEPVEIPKKDVVVSLKNVDPEKKREVIKRLTNAGVTEIVAHQLTKSHELEQIENQLEWLPHRKANNQAALIVKAIKENYSPPPNMPQKSLDHLYSPTTNPVTLLNEIRTNRDVALAALAEQIKLPSKNMTIVSAACKALGLPNRDADAVMWSGAGLEQLGLKLPDRGLVITQTELQ